MINIQDLHKSFDGNKIIKGISLEIKKGELLALIGGSGNGKSVLLKHIAGLLKPNKGRVLIDGNDMCNIWGKKLLDLRKRLGFLFQGGAMFDSMNVYDNIAFPLREKTKMSEDEIKKRVSDELAHVGLTGAEEKFSAQLSGGMKKRAALARELICEPEIMLFDEPTTGLDPLIGNAILQLIHALHSRLKFTGIIVTHELKKVFEIVDQVAMIHEGKILATGTSEEILSSSDPIVKQFVTGDSEGPILYH